MLRLNHAPLAALGLFLISLQPTALAESDKSNLLEIQLAQATQLAIADNHDGARDLLQKIAREYPGSPEAYNNLAVLAAYSEDWEEAIGLLKQALATSASLQTSYQNLNAIYRYRAALAYRAALPTEKSSPLPLPDLTMLDSPAAQSQPASLHSQTTIDSKRDIDDSDADYSKVRGQIEAALQSWATAWSKQDVEKYLSSYADNYQPDTITSHQSWRSLRRERLLKPAFIEVTVRDASIDILSAKRALVTFTQSYRSTAFSDSVKKLLVMQQTDNGWNISREHVIQ